MTDTDYKTKLIQALRRRCETMARLAETQKAMDEAIAAHTAARDADVSAACAVARAERACANNPDVLRFIQECLTPEVGAEVSVVDAFVAYREWALVGASHVLNRKQFTEEMGRYFKTVDPAKKHYGGIRIRLEEETTLTPLGWPTPLTT